LKKILLVGCGDMGSRHLQGLVKLPFEKTIEIIEPNQNAKNLAKSRLNEIEYSKKKINLTWHSSIKESHQSDITIISTQSDNRVNVFEDLLELGNSRFLVEKMVCQSINDYDHILSIVNSNNAKAWVNTPKRYWDSYKKIKNQIKKNKRIAISISAGGFGLSTNVIHFIDLLLWLTNDKEIFLNGDYLDNVLLPNKRGIKLKEFLGKIIGKTSNGSTFSINYLPYSNLPVVVNIIGEEFFFIINETDQMIYDQINHTNSGFKIEYQSMLQSKIINDIFEKDESNLPTLLDLRKSHEELFRIFNSHIKKITNEDIEKCPIT
jgi:predicted dehydrogenase